MIEAATRLQVSQTVLEEQFYMIDLPALMYARERKRAEERLLQLRIAHPPTEKHEAEAFVRQLAEPLNRGADKQQDQFDAAAFAMFKARLGGGGR